MLAELPRSDERREKNWSTTRRLAITWTRGKNTTKTHVLDEEMKGERQWLGSSRTNPRTLKAEEGEEEPKEDDWTKDDPSGSETARRVG